MKRRPQKLTLKLAVLSLLFTSVGIAGNPLDVDIFAPDPSAHVWKDGKLWVYPSKDTAGQKDFSGMKEWHAFSSTNLVDWEDHGRMYGVTDIPWAKTNAWAPDCAYKDGTYYFYFPIVGKDEQWWIGVATSDSPAGPWSDPVKIVNGIDPCVFIDDDGSAYLYTNDAFFQLEDDMKSVVKEKTTRFDDVVLGVPGGGGHHEGSWLFKRDGKYYYTFPGEGHNTLYYAIGNSPLGPFHFQGVIMYALGDNNNHHSIVKYKDRWILFYHKTWKKGEHSHRAMCADYLYFNEDGKIRTVLPTDEGVRYPHPPNPEFTDLDPSVNFLQNGDFNMGLNSWKFSENGANIAAQVDEGQLTIKVKEALGDFWKASLAQPVEELVKYRPYTVSFKAKSTNPLDELIVQLRPSGYFRRAKLTDEFQEFSYTGHWLSEEDGEVVFFLGQLEQGTVTIDDIRLSYPTPPDSMPIPEPVSPLDLPESDEVIHLEAEDSRYKHGVNVEDCSEGTQNISFIENGDTIGFAAVGLNGHRKFTARVASVTEGSTIEIRKDRVDGELLGVCELSHTGGFQSWETFTCDLRGYTGCEDIFLIFKGGDGFLFNLNWIQILP